jgi:hypothetical protein
MLEKGFSDFHCSLDQRSWIDPVTNSTFFSPTQSMGLMEFFIYPGELPDEFSSSFLHESAHHWCFHSRVGFVLAGLQMQAYQYASKMSTSRSSSEEDKEEELRLLEYLIRYTTAISLMRPLAEGLALFAQFDATPGDMPIRSEVMNSVFELLAFETIQFTDWERAGQDDRIDRAIRWALAHLRLNEAVIESKAGLLTTPLSEAKGGYSLGYFLVRSLQRRALAISERFNDSDFFLTYLRSFFYDDLGFTAVLLDPHTHGIASANAIISYFKGRLNQCLASELTDETQLIEWIKMAEESSENLSLSIPSLLTEEQAAKLGQKTLLGLINDIRGDSEEFTHFRTLLLKRNIINIGRFNALIEIKYINPNEFHFDISDPTSQYKNTLFAFNCERAKETAFSSPLKAKRSAPNRFLGKPKETGFYL